ncbi:hypothetical protein GF361_01050 [Candidatus Woesearchaeota archaeon]|nr:hypothetical protein [Candidatus Woesearchaeota archaeon]
MAKKKTAEKKIERTYNVPLRRKWLNVPKYKRAKKAVFALNQFMEKHMKSDNIKIGKYLNEHIWKHGIKNPPHHVKVVAKKDSEGVVDVELEGAPVEEKEESKKGKKSKEKKKEEKKDKKEEKSKKKESKKGKTEKKKEEPIEKGKKESKKDTDKKP